MVTVNYVDNLIILTFYHFNNKKDIHLSECLSLTSNALSSQPVSRQVLSAYECLTTVFGMGTGGSTQLSSLDILLRLYPQNYTEEFMSWTS